MGIWYSAVGLCQQKQFTSTLTMLLLLQKQELGSENRYSDHMQVMPELMSSDFFTTLMSIEAIQFLDNANQIRKLKSIKPFELM